MMLRRWVLSGLVLGLSYHGACSSDAAPSGTGATPPKTGATAGSSATPAAAGHASTPTTPVAGKSATSGAVGAIQSTAGTGLTSSSSGGASGGSGSGGVGAAAAGSGPVAGAGGAAGSGTAGVGGASATAGAAAPAQAVGGLPAIMDPGMPGPFKAKETANVGPMGGYTTFQPEELGKDGVKHPILVFGPGAGAYADIYQTLLMHVASHGFVVVCYSNQSDGPALKAGIDWIIEESKKEGSEYFNKVDTTKIAMGGQSLGSLSTFDAAKGENRILTTLHINGGTFDHSQVANLQFPAFFICGDDPSTTGGDGTWQSDMARPNCDADFMNAKIPVWYGIVVGSSHTTVIDQGSTDIDPLKTLYFASTVAWLRYQLQGDPVSKALFVGDDCGFCKDTKNWLVKQKDLK